MIEMLCAQLQVLRWRKATKLFEVTIEVSLIEIPGVERDLGPIRRAQVLHFGKHSLKANEPLKSLWRKPHFLPKHLDEAPLTEIGRIGEVRDKDIRI
jgi:hypothetical protein